MTNEAIANHDSISPRMAGRIRPRHGLLILAILVITVAALRWEGRRWWCACGQIFLWSGKIASQHNSQHLLDPYSLTHVLHGLLFFAALHAVARRFGVGTRLVVTVCLESLWEVAENSYVVIERYRHATMALGYSGDSVMNSLGDIGSCTIGFVLASRLPVRWSIAFFVGAELLLLALYRDSLLLNVLMLLWPLQGVKAWQMGR
jgi:hypothetical protein